MSDELMNALVDGMFAELEQHPWLYTGIAIACFALMTWVFGLP